MFRDLTPKDFYYMAALDEEQLNLSDLEKSVLLMGSMCLSPQELPLLPMWQFNLVSQKFVSSVMNEKIMSLEAWLETGFHLCKNRWGSDLDWLEEQPMSKIVTMMNIQAENNKKDSGK